MSLFWDILSSMGGAGGVSAGAAGDIGGQVAGGQGIFGVMAAGFATITDGKMWRSLGWLLLGLIVFSFGINLWLHNPVGRALGDVGKLL